MSMQLALASTLSVLMMIAYVLLGGDAHIAAMGPAHARAPVQVSAPAMAAPGRLQPAWR